MDETGLTDESIHEMAENVGKWLKIKKWRMITAESCTGGTIAGALTSVPGSSAWCEGGFVTYSNAMKSACLGVDDSLFPQFGAVSRQVVEAMAQGALRGGLADISVAVSGIAGPGGGTEEKPVGTVWLGWCLTDGETYTHCFHLDGSREQIRQKSVFYALKGVLSLCTTGELCFNNH